MAMRLSFIVKKTRYTQIYAGNTWYVDVFHAENQGLVLAEIEVPTSDKSFDVPSWIGEEVTEESRYSNVMLSQYPFTQW
jgi:adenylate cyclase